MGGDGQRCLSGMIERDMPGYAIGGLAGGESKDAFWRVVAQVRNNQPPTLHLPTYPPTIAKSEGRQAGSGLRAGHGRWCVPACRGGGWVQCAAGLPWGKPRYLMGVGYPLDLVVCTALGVDM